MLGRLDSSCRAPDASNPQFIYKVTSDNNSDNDLPYDGAPEKKVFVNHQGLKIQTYCWKPSEKGARHDYDDDLNSNPRAVVAILHGARTHTRLSWLSKQPSHPAYKPLYCASDYILKSSDGGGGGSSTSTGGESSMNTSLIQSIESCSMSTVASEPRFGDPYYSRMNRNPGESSDEMGSSLAAIANQLGDKCCNPQLIYEDSQSEGSSGRNSATGQSAGVVDPKDQEIDRDNYPIYSGSWIEAFVESNLWVYGLDLQGHGRSEGWKGQRCTFREFDDLREDLIQFLEIIRAEHDPSVPLIVIGVSLSGPVVIRVLEDPRCKGLSISGVIIIAGLLSKPAHYAHPSMKFLIKAVGIAEKMLPQLPLIGTSLPEKEGDWQGSIGARDPYLYRSNFTAHLFSNTLAAVEKMEKDLPKLLEHKGTPRIYFIHNWDDPINPPLFSMKITNRLTELQQQRTPKDDSEEGQIDIKCTLLNYPGEPDEKGEQEGPFDFDTTKLQVEHTLTSDIDNGYVFKLVVQWIQKEILEQEVIYS